MKNRLRLWLSLGGLASVLLAGCGGEGPVKTQIEEARKVVFLSARGERPFETGQRNLLARLTANDARYQIQILDAGFSAETQRRQFQEAMAQAPYAIVLDALETAGLESDVRGAVAKGVQVIGLGESSVPLGCTSVLVADQKKLGQLAGELVVKALKAKAADAGQGEAAGRVIEIRGDDESLISQQRHEGFEAALKAAPGVILVHDAPGEWSLAGGRDRAADALRLQQSFDIVYAHNDLMALGAAATLKDRRENVMIIGTDGFRGREGGMTLVGDGEIDATVYQPLLVDFAWVLLKKMAETPGFQPKTRYEMPLRTILPKDVDDIHRNGLPKYPEF